MADDMCRENIELSVVNYEELMKFARVWHHNLSLIMEATKVKYKNENDEIVIVLNKDLIPEEEAVAFFELLLDAEISAYDENDLMYFARLGGLWRPIAEGSEL